ncbi:hypothetical protein PspLS_04049 [Pyricularia sp. CBS 133598]|nr:hypothetical protein PspLS_04049 [Pyricularia sp. CBS 133598]
MHFRNLAAMIIVLPAAYAAPVVIEETQVQPGASVAKTSATASGYNQLFAYCQEDCETTIEGKQLPNGYSMSGSFGPSGLPFPPANVYRDDIATGGQRSSSPGYIPQRRPDSTGPEGTRRDHGLAQ